MEVIEGRIVSYDETGQIVITTQYDDPDRFIKRGYKTVRIGLQDSRKITAEQRKKIYALTRDIADFVGEDADMEKEVLKDVYRAKHWEEFEEAVFSLSDCSMTTATGFITMLVKLIIEWDVPTRRPLIESCEDIGAYHYACLMNKKCAVCGKPGELSHIDTIGMGNDRTKIVQEGMECMCNCRAHHAEYHKIGHTAFMAKYHLENGVKLDDKLCKVWKVRAKG